MTPEIELIAATDITKYHFVQDEVLDTMDERRCRYTDLTKAMNLAKIQKKQATVVFETKEGIKSVESIIAFINENMIWLKDGATIPVICIREVLI